MLEQARAELAPTGTLRAAINMMNPLLVTGRTPDGGPAGVAPDMAAAIAARLGVPVSLLPFPSPGDVADAAATGEWDICLIAYEPKRAETIAFAPPYVEIEATYLVPAGSTLTSVDAVDKPGVRIAVSQRSAYDLYLSRSLKHAELCRAHGLDGALKLFTDERLDALAGLRPALLENQATLPGSKVLDGRYTSVGQAVGCLPGRAGGLAFLRDFVTAACASGMVAAMIARHGVTGRLQVAMNR
jgi:polar amino acid transport system substrate-binding protein